MKYTELKIQTQRQAPNNARTEGFAMLVRAGYITRENELLGLGKQAIIKLRELSKDPAFLIHLSLPTLGNKKETYFPISTGPVEIMHCKSCNYANRLELAQFAKTPRPAEDPLPLEKVLTPDCNTIESLANFLDVPKEKTAKALMYSRASDSKFIFIVLRGDMQMSESKLKDRVGDALIATMDEIGKAGAVAGYASAIGLKDSLIVVDDLIPKSNNLVAGANEAGYHYKNTNLGRDYAAEIIADLAQARAGDPCFNCGNPLAIVSAILLATRSEFQFENILLALAETHHDDKGLILPRSAAPFDVYLMHVPGKQMDTRTKAEELYETLQANELSVLFDDRDEQAGVKFNDADLIGCPLRITVGERALQNNAVEIKHRKSGDNENVDLDQLVEKTKAFLLK